MNIRAKLLSGFLAIALLCALVGGIGIIQLGSSARSIGRLSESSIPALEHIGDIRSSLYAIKSSIRTLANPMTVDDETQYKRQLDNVSKFRDEYNRAIEEYDGMAKTPEEARLWKVFKDQVPTAKNYNESLIALVDQARALKARYAVAPPASPSPAPSGRGGGQAAQAAQPSGLASARAAIYDQVYDLISGDKRLVYDNMLAAMQDLQDYDLKLYAGELPRTAMASARAGITVMAVIVALAIAAAAAVGLYFGGAISASVRHVVERMRRIAAGDLSQRAEARTKDELGELAGSVNACIDNIKALVADADMLSRSAVEGKLSTRADAGRHQGDYRKIVEGVNATLDAVIGPLNIAAGYVDRIAKGDIPPRIAESYSGDFNLLKDNLNTCIDAVNALVADASVLVQAAAEGRLSTRADAGRHQGDYRKIVDGVNRTLDLVITPINETVSVLKRLADGDLTLRMTGDYKGDFDILKTALNDSLESFNDILGQVNVAVDQVAEGALQVSQASQSLSQGATEQAASLEEITSSVTEIASQTKLNTENAEQVNGLANGARENAEQGNDQMQKLVVAMGDINRSAEEIKKITKAIDDISFQINLLALNANVEAARAGKYGKGFAVVAEEVRNLAVRSANSVKETTRMVDEAIANIARGNELCDLTAKQLTDIVGGAAKVASLAEEVATAGREQAQGLEQVSTGLNQIDQVTQANTASSEESASASEELSSQSQQVKGMLSRFRLKAKEGRLDDAEVLRVLRSEMARQGGTARGPAAAAAPPRPAQAFRKASPRVPDPADVISLDDDNFGKF